MSRALQRPVCVGFRVAESGGDGDSKRRYGSRRSHQSQRERRTRTKIHKNTGITVVAPSTVSRSRSRRTRAIQRRCPIPRRAVIFFFLCTFSSCALSFRGVEALHCHCMCHCAGSGGARQQTGGERAAARAPITAEHQARPRQGLTAAAAAAAILRPSSRRWWRSARHDAVARQNPRGVA